MILRTGKFTPAEAGAQMQKAVKPNLVTRLGVALDLVRGKTIDYSTWFGPLQPLDPIAPEEVKGRRFDFPTGFNINTAPRGIDGTGYARPAFAQLRALAENYDLMRLVIETRKDQLVKMKWLIQARDEDQRKDADSDPRIDLATKFFQKPDRERDWQTWLRAVIEDVLVIDAVAIYPQRTNGGQLYALELIDGATIKPVIDDLGRRPLPPDVAYQEVLKGLPAIDYAADELFYFQRNPRTDRVYGFPPVEQVMMTVNIAIRRQLHQLEFYTAGTVPDMMVPVPDAWSPDQIGQFQQYWDALLADNTAERRRVRFVPAGIGKGAVQTKEAALKDDYDEWLARIVCYAFSVSPQWATKQMNRATAESAQEQALQEGLAPLLASTKRIADRCLDDGMGFADLEFAWVTDEASDPKTQSDILNVELAKGAITLDEYRAKTGREPYPDGLGAKPLIYTGTGAVTLESIVNPPEPPPAPETPQGASRVGEGAGGPPKGAEGEIERSPSELNGHSGDGAPAKFDAMAKAAKTLEVAGDNPAPKPADRAARPLDADGKKTKGALKTLFGGLLAREGKRIAALARKGKLSKMKKAAGDSSGNGVDDWLDAAAWEAAEAGARKVLAAQATTGASAALAAIGLDDADITKLSNENAVAWSNQHAAELVSKVAGTTRDTLRSLVTQNESSGGSVATLADTIQESTAFSSARADLIAHTETRTADNQGALAGMKAAKQSGVQVEKRWYARGNNVCIVCDSNEGDGWIEVDDDFNSGDDAAPAHPRCECDTEFRTKDSDQEE